MNFKATNFEFTSYEFKPEIGRAIFNYKTEFEGKEPILWTETIVLPSALGLLDLKDIPKEQLEKILQSLHIILGISYYKFYCPPAVTFAKVKEGATDNSYCATNLTKAEAEFWNIVYKKGLGEFFYRNNLNPNKSPKFSCANSADTGYLKPGIRYPVSARNGYLVGVSGGKDSIVGVELLKETGECLTAFYVETLDSRFRGNDNAGNMLVNEVTKLTGLNQLKLQRILDPKVFEKHAYNGHIPISAIYAFLGIFACVLYKYDGFVVSNEYSSNFGNAEWKNLTINHQWSKTFEFEKMFSEFIKQNISEDILYFSILRTFYEIRVVEMFCKYPKYFYAFSSCNANFKIKSPVIPAKAGIQSNEQKTWIPNKVGNDTNGLWCGKCAKCVFVFTLLSAFLNKKDLVGIFKKNLYQDKELLPLFKDILGFGKLKPFDCVGTFEESKTAIFLAKSKFKNDFIIKTLTPKIKNIEKLISRVFSTQTKNNVPEKYKFLGMKNALVLGYGKEGTVTKKYLEKFYSKLKIKIAENIDSKNYASKQAGFDIAIKTPGINKNLVTIPHTTATNIFLSKVIENNTVIGITGSKGKSTTSTLIYEILKQAGKDVEFLGNIGKPMLEYLLENKPAGKIFVLEFSSYQLDDIKFSPHISVVTNLFPEHLNYHGSLKNYYEAKKNIINFQNKNNYFVYNLTNNEIKKWLENYKGKAIAFGKSQLKSNLLGEHNKSNIGAAVEVAKILNIPEEIIAKTVENFKGLPHRLEFVGEFKGIKFYDDAISTTPESTIEAIKSLTLIGKINTIFLGGEDREYKFETLAKLIKTEKIKNIVLFPDSGKKIKKALGKNYNFFETKSMREAVKFAYKFTEKGSICLLSCASPSYSVWKNFEEKGDLFKKFVKNEKAY